MLGLNSIRKVVQTLLKDSKLDGFFTNHSLRRTSTTRLFRKGVDRKLIKEFTGHTSDAIDQYQITSDEQRKDMSRIISGEHGQNTGKNVESKPSQLEVKVKNTSSGLNMECTCAS